MPRESSLSTPEPRGLPRRDRRDEGKERFKPARASATGKPHAEGAVAVYKLDGAEVAHGRDDSTVRQMTTR